ncbi:MAG: holo-ACP synthase [Syntrophomonadaceae bacterium]|nr:holo-ACP synthase [Syntrophomonadaceae bacterium]
MGMVVVGIDIVDIERFTAAARRTPRMLTRLFTPQELEYCRQKGSPYASLAARFAIREAFRKLHPAFVRGLSFHDVSVQNDEHGKPALLLTAAARQKAAAAGISGFAVSLSHSRSQAIAIVIGEGGNPE